VLFSSAAALMAVLTKAHVDGRLEEKLLQLSKPKLLIIDELGYLPFEPAAAHLFFQLVSRRYELASMLITSNRPVGEWGQSLVKRWPPPPFSIGCCITARSSPSGATAIGCATSAATAFCTRLLPPPRSHRRVD
jgi:hypothetical protein